MNESFFLLLNYWPEEELVFDFGVNCLFKGLKDTKRLIQSTGFCLGKKNKCWKCPNGHISISSNILLPK